MRHPDLDPESDDRPEEPAALTREAVTPRGGFMARPGLKSPPRHAVVIRGGDARPSENIPVARGSHPPPVPVSAPAPHSAAESEQVTLRAIPTTRKSERSTQLELSPSRPVVAPLESVPPPSDMPVVASVPARDLGLAQARRRARARWTIVAAAAAGLLLGLASIVVTRWQQGVEPGSLAVPAAPVEVAAPAPAVVPVIAPEPAALPSASSNALTTSAAPVRSPVPVERSTRAGAKRSIF